MISGHVRAALAALSALGLVAACTGDDFEAGSTAVCGASQVSCAGVCVDRDDPAFGCGSCAPCALEQATAACLDGVCAVAACQPGFGDCVAGGGCESSLNTIDHCGACGVTCEPGAVCDQGKCADSCSAEKTQCGSSCVNTESDPLHCGGCDLACPSRPNALSVCAFGKCALACTSGFLDCDGKPDNGCEVNSLDTANCGACGNACDPGEICSSGSCVLSCGGGTTECAGSCVDLATDENNCGDCGKGCAGGQNCVGSSCKLNCGGGTTECNGVCAATQVDPNNCGGCGIVCGAGYECENGACEPKCAAQQPITLFKDDFASGAKGWQLDPPWSIGSAKSSSGHEAGFPDPSFDATSTSDNGVAGVVIGGNAPTTVHDYLFLTSPPLNAAAATSLFLGYSRWLNTDYEPFMKSIVQVFDGTSWQTIWQSGLSPGITDNAWVEQSFEITQYKNAALRVRFGYKVGDAMVYAVSGWNLDDVTLTAVTCL